MDAASSVVSKTAAVGGIATNASLDLPVDGSEQEMASVVTWLLVVCVAACLFKFRWCCFIQHPAEGKRLWGVVKIPEGEVWQCRRKDGTVKQTIRGPEIIFAFRMKLSQAEESSGQKRCCPATGELGRRCESGCGGGQGGWSLEAQAPEQLSLNEDSTTTMLQSVQTSCAERSASGTNPCE